MEKEPLISIIIPIYKVEAYLDRCVASIVNQTYKNLEIILVDDGSPDKCPQMSDEWAEKDSRIKVIHKENGGVSDARNAGMKVCSGELIAFVDSDDWIHLDFYKSLYDAMVVYDCDIAECDYIKTTGEEPNVRIHFGEPLVCKAEEAMRLHIADKCFKPVVWNKLYKRELITVEFEKGKYHEDVFWIYQIIANAKKLVHVHSEMLYYFQRSDSIMGEAYSPKRLDALYAKRNRAQFIKESFPCIKREATLDLWLGCLYHGQKVLACLKNEEKKKSFEIVKKIFKESSVSNEEIKTLSLDYKVWALLSQVSLGFTCSIRNLIRVGI